MSTRRQFLLSASAAAAAGGSCAGAETSALPPAIAALSDRRQEAQPIGRSEQEARLERARVLMRESRLDAIALAGGTSLEYFTSIQWWNSERLFLCVLPQKANPFYVCPAFEEDRAREAMAQSPAGREAKVLTWQEDDDPYALVAQGLRDSGISAGRLGMEERVPFVFSEGVRKAAPRVEIASATPVTAGCRMIKSAAELKLMQLANDVTLQVYEAAWKSIHPGMNNREVSELIAAGYTRTGFPGDASCQVDAWSALPHGSREPQVIHEGSIVMIDDGCQVEGYQSDITRTFVIGKATEKMKRVFDAVHKAQTAARMTAKPGVECQAVDAAARKVVEGAGFGTAYTHFTHRVGHGIGMDGHEWPYLVKGNRTLLAANMTTSDEPGVYLRGEFGVRLEDDMYVTSDGAKWFTPQSNSLEQPFAR
jgi:Xaa-Pro dipeptidase